MLKLHVTVIRS